MTVKKTLLSIYQSGYIDLYEMARLGEPTSDRLKNLTPSNCFELTATISKVLQELSVLVKEAYGIDINARAVNILDREINVDGTKVFVCLQKQEDVS